MFYNNLLWSEGASVVLVLMVFVVAALLFCRRCLWLVGIAFLLCLYFFRNPNRTCNEALNDPTVLVCPADGKVVDVQYDEAAPFHGCEQKVSIFLSPFDVHVNWMPVAGTVERSIYKSGTFSLAFLPKSSELNERNDVRVMYKNDKQIVVRQIAGTIARRLVCWLENGDTVVAGQPFGMIKFGSRVEVMLPSDVKLAVGIGQRVYGGQTVLGRWKIKA